jgi:hypothetical protein
METALSLSEKIYLLAIHPQKGGMVSSAFNQLNYVVSGAILLELFLGNKIRFEGKKVILKDSKSSDPVLKLALEKIGAAKSPRNSIHWVSRISYSGRFIRGSIRQSLAQKRWVRVEQRQFLFFRWKKVYLLDKIRVAALVAETENRIFRGTENPEERYLLSLLLPSGLLRRLFPVREKRKLARQKLKQMEVENVVSKAVADVIRASRAAAAS